MANKARLILSMSQKGVHVYGFLANARSYLNLSKIIFENMHSFFNIASFEVCTSCPNLCILGRDKKYGFRNFVLS